MRRKYTIFGDIVSMRQVRFVGAVDDATSTAGNYNRLM